MNIVERLRAEAEHGSRPGSWPALMREAAAEIERLRAALQPFVAALDAGRPPYLKDYDAARNAIGHD